MIFPLLDKTLARERGGDLAALPGSKRVPRSQDQWYLCVPSLSEGRTGGEGGGTGRHNTLPPLALWIKSSMASCWRSSSALATGVSSVRPGARMAMTPLAFEAAAPDRATSSASALWPPVM